MRPGSTRVAGDQEAAPPVVHGDSRTMVTRASGDLQQPAGEIKLNDLARPLGEPEELLHDSQLPADDCGLRPGCELAVTGHMIVMPVRVRHARRDRTRHNSALGIITEL